MKNTGTLKGTTPTGREIVLTRDFDAPRDAAIAAGMERGVAASSDRFAELLASTPARGDSQSGLR